MPGRSSWKNFSGFAVPATVREAEERFAALITDIQGIEQQLGDRTRRPLGNDLSARAQYNDWRTKAIGAKNIKAAERRFLKLWLADKRTGTAAQSLQFDPENPSSLLAAAHRMLLDLKNGGVEFSAEELTLIDAMRGKI
jgi:hypothetical protein